MLCHGLAALVDPEPIVISPLEIYRSRSAIVLHGRPLGCLKEVLPTDIQAVGEVSDVDQSLIRKSTSYLGVKVLIDLPAVNDGRLAALLCGCDAGEPLLHRPAVHVRA